MPAETSPDKTHLYALGEAFAQVLSPRLRWGIEHWPVPVDELPVIKALAGFQEALRAVSGGTPDWFETRATIVRSRWHDAISRDRGKVPLLLRALYDLLCHYLDRGISQRSLLLFLMDAELRHSSSALENACWSPQMSEYKTQIRAILDQAQSKEEIAQRIEEAAHEILRKVKGHSAEVKEIEDARRGLLQSAILEVDIDRVERGACEQELRRVDPAHDDVVRLGKEFQDWCDKDVVEHLRPILWVGFYQWYLTEPAAAVPHYPAGMFPPINGNRYQQIPGYYQYYARAFALMEYFWDLAAELGELRCFENPKGVVWEALRTTSDLQHMVEHIQHWIIGLRKNIPIFLKFDRPDLAGR